MSQTVSSWPGKLATRLDSALRLVEMAELLSQPVATAVGRIWLSPWRLVDLYEMAYLRMFAAWESFLEETFVRYLCGFRSATGPMAPRNYRSLRDARIAVWGRPDGYVLWHNAQRVVSLARQHMPGGPHELVVSSAMADLERWAAVRHRIAHDNEHARRGFERAALALGGRSYWGARAGLFLRDWDQVASPAQRRIHSIGLALRGLARQIAP